MFKYILRICLLYAIAQSIFAVKLTRPKNPKKTTVGDENSELKEGDMLEAPGGKNAIASRDHLWPGGKIPMNIDSQYPHDVGLIERALEHIESQTCLKFVQRTNEENYVNIFNGEGCYSHVGRIGGEQKLSLHAGCQNFGTVLHEILHAIGFYHAHNRSDRDKYLRIHWRNIQQVQQHNFKLLSPEENLLFFPNKFDFNSVMLYGPTAFSKDGRSITMSPVHPNTKFTPVRAKNKLSREDVVAINLLYNCKRARKPKSRARKPTPAVVNEIVVPAARYRDNFSQYNFNPFNIGNFFPY